MTQYRWKGGQWICVARSLKEIAKKKQQAQGTMGALCTTNHVTAGKMRTGFWRRFGYTKYQLLSEVALRVMSVHPTPAATERNWSLCGRVYTSARNALGLERAKEMITFCFNDCDQGDFGLLLSVVEGKVVEGVGRQGEGARAADLIEG
jgi:hypothetical protein